jgi:ABC-type bacteriocin/lantibiotic exporter with double-glycine peptidase domain
MFLLLAGCTATGTPVKDVDLSDKAVVLSVPVVMQNDRFDCGVSALSMLMAYYGKPCKAADTLRAKAAEEQGLTGADLEDYLKSEGFEASLFEGDLSDTIKGLYYHLDRGRPLVTAVDVGGGKKHFVLVKGYDPERELILLQDPQRGAIVFSAGDFEYAWGRASHFTLLATPAE